MGVTLADIDAYDVPDLMTERIMKNNQVPREFATGLLREARRMLYLCAVSGENVAPSDRVDWAWHEMLMFTKYYKAYAEYIGVFVHHVPTPTDDDTPRETWEDIQKTLGTSKRGTDTYNRTKKNYEKFFHIPPDPLYWP